MWFIFITARLFISLSFQPRLTATLLSSCSVVNSPIRRMGLSPMSRSSSLAQLSAVLVDPFFSIASGFEKVGEPWDKPVRKL